MDPAVPSRPRCSLQRLAAAAAKELNAGDACVSSTLAGTHATLVWPLILTTGSSSPRRLVLCASAAPSPFGPHDAVNKDESVAFTVVEGSVVVLGAMRDLVDVCGHAAGADVSSPSRIVRAAVGL